MNGMEMGNNKTNTRVIFATTKEATTLMEDPTMSPSNNTK